MRTLAWLVAVSLLGGCVEEPGGSSDEGGGTGDGGEVQTEQITRVQVSFTPDGGGTPVSAAFTDPDGNGGASGTSQPIILTLATTYTMSVGFVDELQMPSENISDEIAEEAEEHLVLVYGDAVSGPAASSAMALVTDAYADVESDYTTNAVGEDLPLGLLHTITTTAAGSGELRLMLRHLPAVNGNPVKTASLPADFAMGQALPGDPDADVAFDLTVQ